MSITTTKNISLDFYNNNRIIINAKQFDTDARYINITCTDYGKKVTLNPDNMSVFIRYKKSDGNDVLNNGTILEDGTIQMELTQQMLASEGQQSVDVMILAANGLQASSLNDVDEFYKLGVTVISTMTFYINVISTTIDHPTIASSYEYDALINGVASLAAAEKQINDLEEILKENESTRQSNETNRIEAEQLREQRTNEAVQACEDTIEKTNKSVSDAINNINANANTAISNANQAVSDCNTAAANANKATEDAKNFLDNMQDIDETLQKATDAANKAEAAVSKCETFADTATKVDKMTQASSTSNANLPLLLAKTGAPVNGDFVGAYFNTGITVNPNTKTVSATTVKAANQINIGDAIFTFENTGEEKRIVISFI